MTRRRGMPPQLTQWAPSLHEGYTTPPRDWHEELARMQEGIDAAISQVATAFGRLAEIIGQRHPERASTLYEEWFEGIPVTVEIIGPPVSITDLPLSQEEGGKVEETEKKKRGE